MAVRALVGLILALAGVALVEVGYLWGTAGDRAAAAPLICPLDNPEPIAEIPAPPAPALATSEPAPPVLEAPHGPVRRREARRVGKAEPVDSRMIAECARSGGPLCGIPQ